MKKVLVLDNDQSVLNVIQETLIYEGFEVKAIIHTDDIFGEVDSYHPDLIIIDYLLLGINGGEICHQLKTNSKTHLLPVILVSAYPKVLLSLGDYGCDEFIPKPFDLTDFTSRIHKLANNSKYIRSNAN